MGCCSPFSKHSETIKWNSNEMKDPVCGMTVKPTSSHHTQYQGKEYYFCNPKCLTKFLANPDQYLQLNPNPKIEKNPHQEDQFYICPMHPEVRQKGPGSCPKCGMSLEPEITASAVTKMEWTCPMHPEIVRDEPGSCPICGMALEFRTITLEEKNHELQDMSKKFWVSLSLSLPLFFIVMLSMFPPFL